MKRLCALFLAIAFLTALTPVNTNAGISDEYAIIKCGLNYGSNGLVYANLENHTGQGYSLGYFDSDREFVEIAYTSETQITMLKDRSLYITNDSKNIYVQDKPQSVAGTIGCYHKTAGEYRSYASASEAASNYSDGFVAYSRGTYLALYGNYMSSSDASNLWTGSSNCVTVVKTGTNRILFEFDGGSGVGLGVMPDGRGGEALTWFKGYKYLGGFEYIRNSPDGNLTVINVLSMEDYIRGVLPSEMSPSWPAEALKAQAVCARTYAAHNKNKHASYGFDVCNTADCQVYSGLQTQSSEIDRAVRETSGKYITYNGEVASIFYFSSDGGATEDSENVFNEAIPYLRGKIDEYEPLISTGHESWTAEFTAAQISETLQGKGYGIGRVVSITPVYTRLGNIYSITFKDSGGKTFTFSREQARTILGGSKVLSARFSISVKGSEAEASEPETLYIAGQSEPFTDTDVYAIGTGGTERVTEREITVITGSGGTAKRVLGELGQSLVSGVEQVGEAFVFRGSGWGHNVGMSQWGARAMAEIGKDYEDIIYYYFTNVEIRS
ncbi:MAG: SpoIID/LytB domain-containing protein [Oscillospiraceae bacterium]|jgi:stage II sporulation protein D|nr:SpoIID/LytB domain-containing protein [Oscillospiraceae bacterium]